MSTGAQTTPGGFGTFAGVVRPTALTILGAMLYLREGWLVGQGGLLGAWLVILLAVSITGATALSLASIASNVRVRPGGAFAIVSQALGLEAGGAIGVPLYIAQAASSAMYVYAFTEAWAYLFPDHPAQLVALVAYVVLALLAWKSANLAFRAQGLMVWVIGAALLSGLLGLFAAEQLHVPRIVGGFSDTSPVGAFAIFFPAVTGIMVGAGMSGSLADPRRAIPRGTLWAWGFTAAVYLVFAGWYSIIGSPTELVANKTLMIDRALFPPLVLGGLLVSTLMAALSSLVAAPRLLQAMAAEGILPASRWLAHTSPGGDPRNAVVATSLLGALGLLAGSLDAIAPIITSFFIMTYLAINSVVYIEQTLGMISFRPGFRIQPTTPLIGVLLCVLGLAAGSPFGGLLEAMLVVAIFALVAQRRVQTPWETVRSGITVTVAAWAARRAARSERSERAWKPDMLVPVTSMEDVDAVRALVGGLVRRNGSVRWVGVSCDPDLPGHLAMRAARDTAAGVHAVSAHLRTTHRAEGLALAMDALQAALFPPNLVLLDAGRLDPTELSAHVNRCREQSVGLAVWVPGPGGEPCRPTAVVDVWLSDRSPDWTLELHNQNLDLPVLAGILLGEAWSARIRLRMALSREEDLPAARGFLRMLIDQARLPENTTVLVTCEPFADALVHDDHAGLYLFGMPPEPTLEQVIGLRNRAGRACLWLLDSGNESALA